MTNTEPQIDRPTIELKKLKLEVEKIEREIANLSRPPIFHPSAYIPILTALIAVSGAIANVYFTRQDKNQAVAAQKETQSVADQQQLYATSLRRELDNPGQSTKSVTIRFKGALTREVITALQQDFIANGFVAAPPLRTSEVAQSSVTYFHPEDKQLAEQVANQATQFFAHRGCQLSLQTIALTASAANNKPGTILLDIYHSC
jgi:hypothetical protein